MSVHHISPTEVKAERKQRRAKHPHRTVVEHLKKGGHVVTHEYAASDGTPAYGPKFEDKRAFADTPSMMAHLAASIPGKPGEAPMGGDAGGGAPDEDDEA